VLVKSFHTQAAISGAMSLIGPQTVVMSLQNGLGHEDILSNIVGKERVIAGKTYVGGLLTSPGHVTSGVLGKETIIGELNGAITSRIQKIAEEFNKAGLHTQISDNIYGVMWDKLLVNVATGALSAITKLSYGDLYRIPEVSKTAVNAVAEAMEVAKANHIELKTNNPIDAWEKARAGLPPEFKASMLQSIEKGSITEIDFINGAVVNWGKKLNIETPINTAMVGCIKGIESALGLKF